MHEQLIADFERGSSTPARWIKGLAPADLDAHPITGTWSIRELVVHILDSDLAAAHRMRRIAAEDTPLLIAYDESAFVKHLRYDQTDLELVTDLFALLRTFTVRFLRSLPADSFARVGIHNQRGKVSLADMVRMYADHLTHHESFLVDKRRALGKPLSM